ncbi:TetR/AcrR family transcriptional regulator [Mycobacterium sp. smrl_JER01]|uniref:TetR/AcrR family transcriptional regulator n=1 Tax=Mycobacterium sp. smrl_JER01 TaxID=3402633 RepID=UPI003AC8FFB6
MTERAARVDDRQTIIEAAYRCLAEPHSGPIPMSVILRSAGLSSRAFYRHFLSKDDLFLALLEHECKEVVDQVDRIAETGAGNPTDQLSDWVGAMFDLVVDPRQRLQLTVIDSEEVRAAKGYRQMRERFHAERERSLAEILRRGKQDGSFPLAEPETDAVAINAIVSRVLAAQTTDDALIRKQAKVAVLDFALRAVGAAPQK